MRRAVERPVERARRRVIARLVERAPAGVSAEASEQGVVLCGRGLARRVLRDARLQWIAGWLR